MDRIEAELGQVVLHLRGGEPVEELVCLGEIGRVLHDDGALPNFGVDLGHAGVVADLLHVLGVGESERDECYLRVAGLGELRRLGHILGGDELALYLVENLEVIQRGVGGSAVGRVELVGDGDASYLGVGEAVGRERGNAGVFAGPDDEGSLGIRNRRGFVGEVGGDDLLGEGEVGAEEQVHGSAVHDLGGERAGAAEGDLKLDAGLFLVCLREDRHDGLQVGGRSDVQDDRPGLGVSGS